MISFKEFCQSELLLESTPPGMEGWVIQHKPYYSKNKKCSMQLRGNYFGKLLKTYWKI